MPPPVTDCDFDSSARPAQAFSPCIAILSTAQVAEFLRCSPLTVRDYIQPAERGTYTARSLLKLVNANLRGNWPRKSLFRLPDSLITVGEAARLILPRRDARNAVRGVYSMCRRTKNPPPHIRLTKHTVLFDPGALAAWVASRSNREAILTA